MNEENKGQIANNQSKPDTGAIVPETEEQKTQREAKEEQIRTTVAKKKFLDKLRDTMGIVTLACDAAGVGRSTYYDWLRDDPNFKSEAGRIEIEQADFVQDKLLKKIHMDDLKAITFYLGRKHPAYKNKMVVEDKETAEDAIKTFEAKLMQAREKDGNNKPATA